MEIPLQHTSFQTFQHEAIFGERYATTTVELYAETASTLYTKVISIHYQALPKRDANLKIRVINLSFCESQGLLLSFLYKLDDFSSKIEEFYNSTIKKVLTAINGQLFAAVLQARDNKKYF